MVKNISRETWENLRPDPTVILVDVREPEEFAQHNIGGINIPSHLLLEQLSELSSYKTIVVVCSNGLRSGIMARVIAKRCPLIEVLHLQEGVFLT